MNRLDIDGINLSSPYTVAEIRGSLHFRTDHDIEYIVSFDEDSNPYYTAYWFNLTNPEHAKSPGDVKIGQTVICIIEEFFRQNPDILLYLCSTDGGQQAQRSRLFLRWFNKAEQQKHYIIRTAEIKGDDEGGEEYVAVIAQRTNPNINQVLQYFESEIYMFNEHKP